jgi:hypothetical protein
MKTILSAMSRVANTALVAVLVWCAAQQLPGAQTTNITSPGMAEVVKLVQAQVDESIILTYIENSKVAYQPTVDEILYLKELGASAKVTTALLSKGQKATTPKAETTPTPVETKPAQTTVPAPQAGSQTAVVITDTASSSVVDSETDYALDAASVTAVDGSTTGAKLESQATIAAAFQKDLNAYGQWYTIEDYGRCWRPYVAQNNPLWRPYCDRGRWVYTDCGWYWLSEYPWGAITFHYGRWFHHARLGWLWWPHRQWGPAWVVWRRTPLYGGWAPLPPFTAVSTRSGLVHHRLSVEPEYDFDLRPSEYVFAPFRFFMEPNVASQCVSTREVRNLYAQSVVMHRYYVRSDGVVVNEGFAREQVALHTRNAVKMLSIRDYEEDVDYLRSEQILQDGGVAVIYRPYYPFTPGPRPPRRPFPSDPTRLPPPMGYDGPDRGPRPNPMAPEGRPMRPGRPGQMDPGPGPNNPPMGGPNRPPQNTPDFAPTGPGSSPGGPGAPGGSRPPATSPGMPRPSGPSSPGFSGPGGGNNPGGPSVSPPRQGPSSPGVGPSSPPSRGGGAGGPSAPPSNPGGRSGPSPGGGQSGPPGGGQSGPPSGGQGGPGGGQGGPPGGGSGGPPPRR